MIVVLTIPTEKKARTGGFYNKATPQPPVGIEDAPTGPVPGGNKSQFDGLLIGSVLLVPACRLDGTGVGDAGKKFG